MQEDNKTAYAPYNFVPFANKVIERYESPDDLPNWSKIDKSLKTGEIHITMKAETPVYISSTERDFYKDSDGKFKIPASSLRGMIRENMQILGFGLTRSGEDIEDYQIYFRDIASKSVCGELKKYYAAALDIKVIKNKSGKSIATPNNVKSGYIYKKGKNYFILPTVSPVIRVPRTQQDVKQYADKVACIFEVSYQQTDKGANIFDKNIKAKKGVLLCTGRPVGEKTGKVNPLYLFPEMDTNDEPLQIKDDDITSYKIDFENRHNSLKAYYDVKFWDLPKEGQYKPIFFIHHDGHIYFGMSRFLRIGYSNKLSKGLPNSHLRRADEKEIFIDYPHAIFGYATKNYSYHSRVFFEDLELVNEPNQIKNIKTVLGEPRPSYYRAYSKDGKHYNEDDFALRGYKQYWLKSAQADLPTNENEKVATELKPLDVGSVFSGVIHYKNLTEDELGLLLWSLQLEDNCYQQIGMAKPYGFGRMKLKIDKLTEFNFEDMYSFDGLCNKANQKSDEDIKNYIKAYDKFAIKQLESKKKTLLDEDIIKDFIYIKSKVRFDDEVKYMALGTHNNGEKALPSISDVRNNDDDTNNEPLDPMQALLQKFSGSVTTQKGRKK